VLDDRKREKEKQNRKGGKESDKQHRREMAVLSVRMESTCWGSKRAGQGD
jgi:hypothetical protein